MIGFGFSARHWQQIEAGMPITVTTLLRICEVFDVSMPKVVRGLDAGIYETPSIEPPPSADGPIAAILLLESAPQEGCKDAHENLPRLPKDLPG